MNTKNENKWRWLCLSSTGLPSSCNPETKQNKINNMDRGKTDSSQEYLTYDENPNPTIICQLNSK